MLNEVQVFGSNQVAQELGTSYHALLMWLNRHPEYRPVGRFSGDDLLWTVEDIEKVRQARQRTAKHGTRRKPKSV